MSDPCKPGAIIVHKVVVDVTPAGEVVAVTPYRARRQYKVEPELVYVRADGWAVGCLEKHQDAARNLYAGRWRWLKDLRTGVKIDLPLIEDQI